jgi:hemerythrin-like domain-containing protein
MANPITAWQEDHANFTRLLDMLERQVSAFNKGEHPNYDLMADIVQYLRAFSDRVHHPREDVAFTRLVAKEPDIELVVNRLLQEHRVILAAGSALEEEIDRAVGDVMASREALEAAAAQYLVYYRNHLRTEETRILPRAAKLLTPEDWAAVVRAVPPTPDPLFGATVETRFRELRRQIDREAGLPLER